MKITERQKAIVLRQQGYSINEITEIVNASKSSVSLWVRNIHLSEAAKARIEDRMTKGQIAAKAAKYQQTAQREEVAKIAALKLLKSIRVNEIYSKLLCAMIYYCEGAKSMRRGVTFTNSDPSLMRLFLSLFRKTFTLDENKFRVCVHLHSYHNKEAQLKFWSKTTTIPLRQFIKPYQKAHSGIYKKEGYQGCIAVSYHDVRVSRELKAIAVEFMKLGL